MSVRVDPAVWAERQEWIHKQIDSGFSVARFCREHGLHIGNFHAWKLKLGKDSQVVLSALRPVTEEARDA